MVQDENEEPRLIQTSRGFSVLYQNKYLYSKYDPQRQLLAGIASLEIPDSALVLCFSPVLDYGIRALIEKLPASSFILAIEYDPQLMRFSAEHFDSSLFACNRFSYICAATVQEVAHKIESLALYPFKKCMAISCSGGAHLYRNFYERTERYISEFIARFWSNRLTIMHMGRNYVHNGFHNLISLLDNPQYSLLTGKERITKPVLVMGAGPSLEASRDFIIRNRKNIFLMAVDAAAAAFLPEIRPDAVVLVESQYWIDSAFIGLQKLHIPLFADLTASHRAVGTGLEPLYLFYTEYAPLRCLQRFYQTCSPLKILPMGSVGLTALELALRLTEPHTPVLHTGLDFSWSVGLTHARGSSSIKKQYTEINRICPPYAAHFPSGIRQVIGKNERPCYTTPTLSAYAGVYHSMFAADERVIDIGMEGCRLRLHQPALTEAERLLQAADVLSAQNDRQSGAASFTGAERSASLVNTVRQYLIDERRKLAALLEHLQGKRVLPQDKAEQILMDCDYLYSHFPDATHGYVAEASFLKRVRIELAYVLKILSRL